MRLIDADALIKELEKLDWQELYLPIHFKEWLIDEAPTIDAVPVVHGHWIDCDGYRECSRCGWLHAHNRLNYCPICGAKMDEVTEWRAR